MKMVLFPLMLALMVLACVTPARAQVQVLPPAWAYQLSVGMRLAELRTVAGKQYTHVTIEALDTMQVQFTHSRGRRVEYLVSIRDPNTYEPAPQRKIPQGQGQWVGPLAVMMSDRQRAATGADKLDDNEQMTLKSWLGQARAPFPTVNNGMQKLSPQEKSAMEAWLDKRRVEMHPSLVAGPPSVAPQLPVNSSILGDFLGFAQGRVFQLSNHQSWQQIDNKTIKFYRDITGKPVRVNIRASGLHYLMSVEGAGEILVKPVR